MIELLEMRILFVSKVYQQKLFGDNEFEFDLHNSLSLLATVGVENLPDTIL
jgi:hypothetical protein